MVGGFGSYALIAGGQRSLSVTLGPIQYFGPNDPPQVYQVLPADLNHDGKMDVVIFGFGATYEIDVALGNGDGTFQPLIRRSFSSQSPNWIALADLNNDGNLDVAAAGSRSGVFISLAMVTGRLDHPSQPTAGHAIGSQ